jgi:hypothetical protein
MSDGDNFYNTRADQKNGRASHWAKKKGGNHVLFYQVFQLFSEAFFLRPLFEFRTQPFQLLTPVYNAAAVHEAQPVRAPPKTDSPVPIEEHTFQSTAAYRPVSWGRQALKIATHGTGGSP